MKQKKRIGIIFGGRSCEHEVSLASAASVVQNLDAEKYDIVPIAITKDGAWLWGVEPQQLLRAVNDPMLATEIASSPVVTLVIDSQSRRFISINKAQPLPANGELDVLFPVLHGPYGEDGTIQGLFEMANIPYVGCGVLGSAAGMDKEIMKELFQAAGLPVVKTLTYRRFEWEREPEHLIAMIEHQLAYPCFVKPANLGSSIGVSRANDRDQLIKAMNEAFTYDRKIEVEQGINCREFSCAVLGNDEPSASVVGEILPGDEFSDYEDKYVNHTIQFVIPATIPTETAQMLRDMALRAYQALDLQGLSRVDFFQDKVTGRFYINEVNTLPGFTEMSLYPKLWAASGLAYSQLLDQLIELALRQHETRQQLRSYR
ncbi:D-alanine--D-alanine ligase A [Ktedonobacter sp. SOSP1-85]|uniref:D-alanine--D-alanine ligase family protein n=1 Tax=Ktedonobacter sp. SOSP1-85 TaxID=2778367 RepID=UPI0019154241|nr:D-alanine--D-alanine ligase family protein [Ktedonobacter sp. SOSP1-85]GHO76810.1 D-alanine--D-alanine ligase A [Ktedonobacter sp. SOSP1-85]